MKIKTGQFYNLKHSLILFGSPVMTHAKFQFQSLCKLKNISKYLTLGSCGNALTHFYQLSQFSEVYVIQG